MGPAARVGGVAAGAVHRGRVDVGGVQLDRAQRGGERGADRTGAAAQVHDDRGVRHLGEGLFDEELGATAGHEDAGAHGDPQSAELRPADDEFERVAGDPAVHHAGQFVGGAGGGEDQPCLVLGEDTARGAECGDDGVGRGEAGRE